MVEPEKSSRRDFLIGRSAAAAAARLARLTTPHRPPSPPAAGSYLVRVSRRAMACDFEVCLNAGQYEKDTVTALKALDLVEQLEGQMSLFRPTSELAQINRAAAERPVEVEPGLFAVLELAKQLGEQTEGAFDITSAPLWRAWGFARRAGSVPGGPQLHEALSRVGCGLVRLDPHARTVRFLRPGVELNLGGIGKGYALDRAAEVLAEAGIHDFLLHGGQSSILARGSRWVQPTTTPAGPAGGWRVGLPHPLRRGVRLAEIVLRDRALATSSSTFQSFRHQGRRYGHIVDPRTGWPAEGVLSATAIAPEAAVADALSTAFYVMGPDQVRRFCQARPETGVVLVCPAGRGPGIQVIDLGVEDDLHLLDP